MPLPDAAEMELLRGWIGRSSEAEDLITPRLIGGFRATFAPFLAPSGKDEAPLGCRQNFPLPGLQIRRFELPNPHAHQPQGRVPDSSGHAPDLPVFSFDQFQPKPTSGNCFAEANGRVARRKLVGVRWTA